MSYSKHTCCFKDPGSGKIVTYRATAFLWDILWNTLPCFYGFVHIWSFLVFYLTIKYSIYCTSKKLLKIIYTVVTFTVIFVLILVVLFLCKVIHLCKLAIIALYAVTILDTLYIIDVVMTYTYIFVVYKRQAKLRKISCNGRINNDQFKFTVPTLVITTYILFTVFPNIWSFSMIINSLDETNSIHYRICRILYPLGWLADPLIYASNLYLDKCKYKRR